jgi:diguanylate cyclase (GGDEF)-like protein/PAS domain S-box-containing protein
MLRAVIDNNQSLIYVKDLDGRYLLVNPAFERAFAINEADLLGNTDVVLDAELAPAWRRNDVRAQQGAYQVEEWSDGTDGSHWYESVKFPLTNADGDVFATCGVSTDVSARRSLESDLRRREVEFRLLVDNSTDMISRHNPEGTFLYVSPVCQELVGYSPADMVGTSYFHYVHPDDLPAITASHELIMATAGISMVTYRMARAGGGYRWLETTSRTIRDEANRVVEIYRTSRDVTARRQAEDAQRVAEARFRGAFDHAPIGVALIGFDRRTVQVNAALHTLLGYPSGALVGVVASSVVHPEDVHIGQEAVAAILRGDQPAAKYQARFLHADGHEVWVSVSVTPVVDTDDQSGSYMLVHVQDISDRRRFEYQLHQLADRDPLTGLLNRRSFERELNRHSAEVARYGPAGALLVVDLDRFKAVNDTMGHKAGDALLVSIAQLFQYTVRSTDHVARLGGDEFAILVPMGGRDAATALAEKIVGFVRRHAATLGGAARQVTASIGIAVFDGTGNGGDAMLIAADLALYQAKAAGRDSWVAMTDPASTLTPPDALRNV